MTSCRVGDDMTLKPRTLVFSLTAILALAAFITINAWTVALLMALEGILAGV